MGTAERSFKKRKTGWYSISFAWQAGRTARKSLWRLTERWGKCSRDVGNEGWSTAVLNSWCGREDGRKGVHKSWIPLKISSRLIYSAEIGANKAKRGQRERKSSRRNMLCRQRMLPAVLCIDKVRHIHSYKGYCSNWGPREWNAGQQRAAELQKASPAEPISNNQFISSITSYLQRRDQVLKEHEILLALMSLWETRLLSNLFFLLWILSGYSPNSLAVYITLQLLTAHSKNQSKLVYCTNRKGLS